jgi:ribosomal protein S2
MKINKKKIKNKLIKLKLIETKIYDNTSNKNSLKISDIALRLKKALHIIYKYHINNKKILFVGTFSKFNKNFKNLFKKTKHILLPKSVWMNGILTNTNSCYKYLIKNQNSISNKFHKTITQLNQQINLIVILDSYYKTNILNEGYLANIPIVFLGDDFNNISNFKAAYNVPGNFNFLKKKLRVNFVYILLMALLKKTTTIKQQKIYKSIYAVKKKNKI